MQFDFGGLVTKCEEYFGKPITKIVFMLVVLGIVAWALRLIYDVFQPILAFVAGLGADVTRNPDLVQASALFLAVAALFGVAWIIRRTWVRTTATIDSVNRRATLAGTIGQQAIGDIKHMRTEFDESKLRARSAKSNSWKSTSARWRASAT